MKKVVLLVLILIIVAGCTTVTKKSGCKRPYNIVNGICCLDNDDNKLCDIVEDGQIAERRFSDVEENTILGSYGFDPAVYKDKIAWKDIRYGLKANPSIMMYDIDDKTEIKIDNSSKVYQSINVYEDKTVWESNNNVYLYDLGKHSKVRLTSEFVNRQPVIYDNFLVWIEANKTYKLILYNLDNNDKTVLRESNSTIENPSIYQNVIVWDEKSKGNEDIYSYDIVKNELFQITNNVYRQYSPKIWGRYMTWIDERSKNVSIYTYNIDEKKERLLATVTRVSGYRVKDVDINRNNVVWVKTQGLLASVYFYNLEDNNGIMVANGTGLSMPRVYNNIVTWYKSSGTHEVYYATIT